MYNLFWFIAASICILEERQDWTHERKGSSTGSSIKVRSAKNQDQVSLVLGIGEAAQVWSPLVI